MPFWTRSVVRLLVQPGKPIHNAFLESFIGRFGTTA
jgi:hypothetical protein